MMKKSNLSASNKHSSTKYSNRFIKMTSFELNVSTVFSGHPFPNEHTTASSIRHHCDILMVLLKCKHYSQKIFNKSYKPSFHLKLTHRFSKTIIYHLKWGKEREMYSRSKTERVKLRFISLYWRTLKIFSRTSMKFSILFLFTLHFLHIFRPKVHKHRPLFFSSRKLNCSIFLYFDFTSI